MWVLLAHRLIAHSYPIDCSPPAPLSTGSPGKNTGMGNSEECQIKLFVLCSINTDYCSTLHNSTSMRYLKLSLLETVRASQVVQMVKNLPAAWQTQVRSLGQEDALEKGMATHSSILAWRIPWAEAPGGLPFMGLQRGTHNWVTNKHTQK